MRLLFKFLLVIFILFNQYAFALDKEIEKITKEIDKVQNKFEKLATEDIDEAIQIDSAINEINKATEFVKESLKNENVEVAIQAIELIEKSLNDVSTIVPQEFMSDMSKADMTLFDPKKLESITEMTGQMKVAKEEKLSDLVTSVLDLNEKGLNSIEMINNLKEIGIDTINIDIKLKKAEEMSKWTKKDWADSYKGSVITSNGSEVITDNEISSNVSELEEKLRTNNLSINNKRTSLITLETKLNPLNLEVADLSKEKSELLAKYSNEINKQTGSLLSDEEIQNSKKLTNSLLSKTKDITIKLEQIENQSSSIQANIASINNELASDVAQTINIRSEIGNLEKNLSSTKNLISLKEAELNQLKNINTSELKSNGDQLSNELQNVALQRDYIKTTFSRSLNKEVEHFKIYGSILGDTDEEIEFSIREVGVLLDADPRNARAFDIEKYGTFAGLSQETIQKGINAAKNDDWNATKEVYKDIVAGLSKNPDWNVDAPSAAELNVMIAEEQAFQKAILAVAEGEKIQQQVNTIIDQKSGPLKEIASLNETTLKYAAITENMKEFNYLTKEYNDVIASSNLTVKSQELEGLRKTVSEGNQWLSQANTTFKRLQTSGQSVTQGMLADFNKKYYEVINAQTNAQSLTYEVSRIQTAATTQARNNLINRSTLAKQEIEKIAQQEISKNPGYNYASQVSEILNDIPTVDQQQLNRVNQVLSGKTSWGITDVNLLNNKGAALKAALDSAETFDAYTTAVSKISELDQVPAFGGVYWEMSNVKLAAIVKSKKYVHVDDYAYLDAYYDKASHLTLSSADRVEAEKELAQILGKDNPQLNALNEEVSQLQSKLDNINNQKSNINQNMSTLEVELQQLKSTDGDLENKLSNLTADLNTKTNLISQRRNSLSELNNQLNPLKENLSNLETEKSSANIKLEEQLNIISKQTVTNSETDINNQKIKTEIENQIAAIDKKINSLENETKTLTSDIISLNNELTTLETTTPNISNQISQLGSELDNLTNLKADLAITAAKKMKIEIEAKIINNVKALENKSIISIDGTNAFRIVNTDTLTDNAGNFKLPTGTMSVNGQVYSSGAVKPEQLLSFSKIDSQGDMKVTFSKLAAEQIKATGSITGQQKDYTGNTLGSWVLVDAVTGKQMVNPNSGHTGSIVCEGSVCGPSGSFGKEAAGFGGMYVMESMADAVTGNVAGRCAGGNCEFNISELKGGISNSISASDVKISDNAKQSLASARQVTLDTQQASLDAATSAAGKSAAVGVIASGKAVGDTISASAAGRAGVGDLQGRLAKEAQSISNSQAALAAASANTASKSITHQLSTQTAASAIAGQAARDIMSSATTQANTAAQAAREAQAAAASAVSNAQKAAAEVQVAAAQAVQAAAQEALQSAQAATQEIQQAARAAQEAASGVVAGISGNDIQALSQLANDALGIWQEVDASGRPVNDQQIVCEASVCGAEGSFGKSAADRGNSYTRTNRTGGY